MVEVTPPLLPCTAYGPMTGLVWTSVKGKRLPVSESASAPEATLGLNEESRNVGSQSTRHALAWQATGRRMMVDGRRKRGPANCGAGDWMGAGPWSNRRSGDSC